MANIEVNNVTTVMRGQLFDKLTDTSAVKVFLYKVGSNASAFGPGDDYSDMLLACTLTRASSVEGEITPMSTAIQTRNSQLEELGKALSEASNIQAQCQTKSPPENVTDDSIIPVIKNVLEKYGLAAKNDGATGGIMNDNTFTPGEAAQAVQLLKSKIDALNNASQTDMTRLQSLVDKRDEAFSLASDLVSSASDTRSTTIRNIGG